MALIQLSTPIAAPRERVFDLSRSIDVHQHSVAHTHERAIAGVTSGLIGLGEEVTWDDQKVTSVDWNTYHSLPLGFAIPKIECALVNQPDERN